MPCSTCSAPDVTHAAAAVGASGRRCDTGRKEKQLLSAPGRHVPIVLAATAVCSAVAAGGPVAVGADCRCCRCPFTPAAGSVFKLCCNTCMSPAAPANARYPVTPMAWAAQLFDLPSYFPAPLPPGPPACLPAKVQVEARQASKATRSQCWHTALAGVLISCTARRPAPALAA
jgi:hypothetical protein